LIRTEKAMPYIFSDADIDEFFLESPEWVVSRRRAATGDFSRLNDGYRHIADAQNFVMSGKKRP
jgi:hypothetical protein